MTKPASLSLGHTISLLLKRLIDIFCAVVGLVCILPILLIIALLVRINLGSPIFFIQARPGLHGRTFKMYKFRSMLTTHKEGKLLPDSERLTKFGRFLRATSIDEFPELINVIKGDMSLVGPRPWLIEYLPHYTPEQMRRHDVRPGITGWAQIHGRNTSSWEERINMDVWYVNNWSLWLDVKILLRTFWTVLRREGISASNHATMPRFDLPAPESEAKDRITPTENTDKPQSN